MRTCVRARLRPRSPASRSPSPPAAGRPWRRGRSPWRPRPGRDQLIGESSAAAEAYGVRAGLRLGEALARCPTLRLVTPDPAGVADAWERMVAALEGIGAAVESGSPGIAWFAAGGLKTLHGGTLEGILCKFMNCSVFFCSIIDSPPWLPVLVFKKEKCQEIDLTF